MAMMNPQSQNKGRLKILVVEMGAGTILFRGGKNGDIPSDCQNLGGHRHIHPIETKSVGGNCPLDPPPPSRAAGSCCRSNSSSRVVVVIVVVVIIKVK